MLKLERRERIKEYLVKNEYADIKLLAEIMNVSTATIRRALQELQEEQVVEITHGGATLAKKGSLYEHPYMVKRQLHLKEKTRIANEAVNLINRKESVFLDSSSTVYGMAQFVAKLQEVNIATNDIAIASALHDLDTIDVSVIGGTLRKHYFTLTGFFAESIMKDLCFDLAFMGFDTVSSKSGLMITNIEEVQIKRMIINASNKVVVLCDHSKFEKEAFLNVCSIKDVDMIITGKELDDSIYNKYIDLGVKIVRV